MSTVKFFALGGLGEVGKNMYVLEVNERIFVLDCGSTNFSNEVFGYDVIIPDIKYLIENVDRIEGIFLSHFKHKNTGGFTRIIKDLKVPYYCSPFTYEAIKKRILPHIPKEELDTLNLIKVEVNEVLEFGETKVEFINLASSQPDTFGMAVKVNMANEGEEPVYKNVVYLPDFDFDQNVKGHFRTKFKFINSIADEGVLALLSPSTGAYKIGHTTTDGKLDLALHKLMAHEGRLYVVMDAENVSGMLQVISAANFQKRHVTIIGNKARTLVEIAMEMNYTPDFSEFYLKKTDLDDENRNDPTTVIIIAGEQTEEFFALQKIAMFQDPHYILKPTDNVTFLLDIPKKYEKILAASWDSIWMDNANLVEFDTKLMPNPCLAEEDIKLLYSLFSPEYVIPIAGDYRMLKAQTQLALDHGFDKDHVVELDNGLFATFENGVLIPGYEGIETGDILFGEESDSDINDYVAREREALTQEGFIVVSGMIDLKTRKTYGDIKIIYSGFLPEFGQQKDEVISVIKSTFNEIVGDHLKQKKVDYKELRLELKNELSKKILRTCKKRPTLIPVVIDISN